MNFLVSHVKGPIDISLKRRINLFHPLISLRMIYCMSVVEFVTRKSMRHEQVIK